MPSEGDHELPGADSAAVSIQSRVDRFESVPADDRIGPTPVWAAVPVRGHVPQHGLGRNVAWTPFTARPDRIVDDVHDEEFSSDLARRWGEARNARHRPSRKTATGTAGG